MSTGRYAPSPSGRMHLGNLMCCLLAWLSAKSKGGQVLLRIEDLDTQRCPRAYADAIIDDLAWLGLAADDVDQRMAMALGLREPRGIIVTRLYPGSPAGKAGIEPGDVIDSINGSPVRDRREYVNILRNQVPGAELTLGVLRGDKPEKIRVKPASFDDATALSLMQEIWGLRVREADGLMLVRETRRPGPTDFLRPGDVIAAIGGMRIRTTADLVNAFRRERLANQVLMQIVRDGRPYYARVLLQ